MRARAARTFGTRLSFARHARRLTLDEVACRTGRLVTHPQVSRWEAGHNDPQLPNLYRLAASLNVSPAWLGGEGPLTPLAPSPAYAPLDRASLAAAFGRRVREARVRRGLSQSQLARRIDSDQGMVAAVEAGRRGSHLSSVGRFAAALGVSLGDLLEDDPEGAAWAA